jgi:hypothetical protein
VSEHEITGPALFVASRPRGGDWLEDEVARWRRLGVARVVSLAEPAEECELDFGAERAAVEAAGLATGSRRTRHRARAGPSAQCAHA